MTIAECTKLHQRAMHFADKADEARRLRSCESAKVIRKRAFEFERRAAMCFKDRPKYEPTRSVLFRSAATLALQCGLKRESERLLCMGLAGNPPDEIAKELRELWRNLGKNWCL